MCPVIKYGRFVIKMSRSAGIVNRRNYDMMKQAEGGARLASHFEGCGFDSCPDSACGVVPIFVPVFTGYSSFLPPHKSGELAFRNRICEQEGWTGFRSGLCSALPGVASRLDVTHYGKGKHVHLWACQKLHTCLLGSRQNVVCKENSTSESSVWIRQ